MAPIGKIKKILYTVITQAVYKIVVIYDRHTVNAMRATSPLVIFAVFYELVLKICR